MDLILTPVLIALKRIKGICIMLKNRKRIVLCLIIDPVYLALQLVKLQLHHCPVFVGVGIIGRLDSQLSHALQDAGHFIHCTISGLNKIRSFLRITCCLHKSSDLGTHSFGNLKSRRIICRHADLISTRQLTGCHSTIQLIGLILI